MNIRIEEHSFQDSFVRIYFDDWCGLAISSESVDYPGLYRDGSRGSRLEIIGVDLI